MSFLEKQGIYRLENIEKPRFEPALSFQRAGNPPILLVLVADYFRLASNAGATLIRHGQFCGRMLPKAGVPLRKNTRQVWRHIESREISVYLLHTIAHLHLTREELPQYIPPCPPEQATFDRQLS